MRTSSAKLALAAAIVVLAACVENELEGPSLTDKAAAETIGGSPGGRGQAAVVPAAGTAAPITEKSGEQAFTSECGACHFAFPPQFLPVRSWQAIMAGLDSHFGENASLDPDTAKQITEYLVANAAGPGSPVLRGLDPQDTPLRITETRLWNRIHHEIRPSVYDRSDIKSKANCLACHNGSGAGHDD
jgi:Dihaem cytochrome c